MHCAVQHKPYAEWHKPCRYYRLLFRNLQVLLPISTAVFCDFPPVLTTTLPALLPMAYAADFRGATRVLWKLPRRRLPHCWGACAFYLLSMVSLHTKTSFLTKPHGSKLSLSSFYGLSHGTGQPLPQFAVPIDHMLPVAYSQRLVVPLTMDIF